MVENGVPIKTLCEKTSLDKSTLTGIFARLERDGFIERKKDENDKRNTCIFLTGKETSFLQKFEKVSAEMNSVFYKGFTEEEIVLFDGMLVRVLENCKEGE